MKKNDDGYVLPFVLVVLIVMALVASTALAAALRNIKTQQNFIERMQDRYQAEGAIEIVEAELENESNLTGFALVTENTIQSKVSDVCKDVYDGDDDPKPKLNDAPSSTAIQKDSTFSYAYEVISKYGSVEITTKMIFSGKVADDTENEGKYKIISPTITYTSYEIGGASE